MSQITFHTAPDGTRHCDMPGCLFVQPKGDIRDPLYRRVLIDHIQVHQEVK